MNNDTLIYNRTGTTQTSAAISGSGSLTIKGGGRVILVEGNTYTGGTTIEANSTLQLGNGSTSGSITGNVANAGTLAFNRSDSVTYSGVISGAGAVTQSGGGTLILTAANTYSGETTIASGSRLQIGNVGSSGSLGSGSVTNNGVLVYNRDGSSSPIISNVISGTGAVEVASGSFYMTGANTYSGETRIAADTALAVGYGGTTGNLGTGAVVNNGLLYLYRSDRNVVANNISGSGYVVLGGTGTAVLTGTNTYSGGTTINNGATLQLGDGGTTGSITGDVTNTGTLAFNRSDSVTFGGVISGAGTLSQIGAGTLILTGANTYTGETTIAAGTTLQIGNGGTTGAIGTGIVANAGTLAFNRSDSVTYSAVLSGTGAISQLGTGTLILTGANTYTGTTTIAAGSRLQIGTGGNTGTLGSGAVTNNGALVLNRDTGSSVTIANAVSGTGALEVVAGNYYLTGNNTYSGETRIAAGAGLAIGYIGTSGSVGTGAVVNDGLFALYRSDRHVVANNISGTGTLVQAGAGTAVLTGTNTYTGATTISSGLTLQVGDGGLTGSLGTGAVSNSGTLAFNRAGQLTQSGAISGTGQLQQNGPGELILTSTNTYTGTTAVNAGTLTVNGSIATSSGLTVHSGARLGGTGTLPATEVQSGGTIQPSGTGTLNVSGNLTLVSGATAAFDIGATTAGKIAVTGSASLLGGVRVSPTGSVFNAPYTLITASSITGTPGLSTSGSFGAGISAALSQTATATAVTLTLTPAPLLPTPPDAPAGNPGQTITGPGLVGFLPSNLRGAGGALDAVRKAGGNLQPFFGVYNAPANQIGNAVNQLTGEVSTASGAMGQLAGQQFLSSMMGSFGQSQGSSMGSRIASIGSADGDDGVSAPRPRYAMWGQAMGGYSRIEGESGVGSASRATRGFGFSMGLDIALGAESLVGIAAGAGETNALLAGGLGTSRAWTGQFGVYGRTRLGTPIGGLTLEGAAALSQLDVESKRTQYFLGSAQQRADYDARVYSFRVEARHDGAMRGGIRMQPFLAVQAQVADSDGFTERSSAPGASTGLRVGAATNSTVRTELGAQAEARGEVSGRAVRGFARLAWAHYLMREQVSSASFISLPGSGFTTIGARPDADSALMTVGLEAELAPRWTLAGRLDSELSSRVREVSGTVRLRYSF